MRITLSVILVFISLVAFSQDVTINWGALSKEEVQLRGLIKLNDEESISLSVQKEGKGKKVIWNAFLTRYNKLEQNKVVPLINTMENTFYESLLQVGGKIYVVINVDTDNDVPDLFIQELNKETLEPAGKPLKIGSFGTVPASEILTHPYIISPDGNKILFRGKIPKTKAKDAEYVFIQYDATMKEEWRNSYSVKGERDYLHSFNFMNDGTLLCLSNIKLEKKNPLGFDVSILLFNKNLKKPSQTPIIVKSNAVTSMKIVSQENDEYKMFGMYTHQYGYGHKGYFTADFNSTDKSFKVKVAEDFSRSLLKILDKQDQAYASSDVIAYGFRPVSSIQKSNGSIDHIIECQSRETIGNSTQFGTGTNSWTFETASYYYTNHSLLVVNVDAGGKSRLTFIPKFQCASYQNRLANGFMTMPYKDKLLFFYNDWKKNIEYSNEDVKLLGCPSNFKKSSFIMNTLQADGSFQRKILFDNDERGFYPAISYFIRVTDNKIIVVGQNAQDKDDRAAHVLGVMEIK